MARWPLAEAAFLLTREKTAKIAPCRFGATGDAEGNLTMEKEALTLEASRG